MGIGMRLVGEDQARIVVEWYGARGQVRCDVTPLGPNGFNATQDLALAELLPAAPECSVGPGRPRSFPTPRSAPEPAPQGMAVNVCKFCLRRHRGTDYMYCEACRSQGRVPKGPPTKARGGRR